MLFEEPQLLKFTHAQKPALSYCFTWIQPAQPFEISPSFEAERCFMNNVQEIVVHRRWMIQASRLSAQTFHLYLAELTSFWWFHRKAVRAINPSTAQATPNQQDILMAGNVRRLLLRFKRNSTCGSSNTLKFNVTLQSRVSSRTRTRWLFFPIIISTEYRLFHYKTPPFKHDHTQCENNSTRLGKGSNV